MATNAVQDGHVLSMTHTSDVLSGELVIIGNMFGIAATDAIAGDEFELITGMVWILPKASGAVALGVLVYWDDTAKNITTTVAGNTLVGTCIKAAATNDADIEVRLNLSFG